MYKDFHNVYHKFKVSYWLSIYIMLDKQVTSTNSAVQEKQKLGALLKLKQHNALYKLLLHLNCKFNFIITKVLVHILFSILQLTI